MALPRWCAAEPGVSTHRQALAWTLSFG